MVKRNLGTVASEGLEGMGGDNQQEPQEPLIPACRVKFKGMSWDSLEEVPHLKDEMEFRVKGTVTAHTEEIMRDGEMREVAVVTVSKVILVPEESI